MDTPFLQAGSEAEASGVEGLRLLVRAEAGTGSLEAPNGPEKEGLPPLETDGVVLVK